MSNKQHAAFVVAFGCHAVAHFDTPLILLKHFIWHLIWLAPCLVMSSLCALKKKEKKKVYKLCCLEQVRKNDCKVKQLKQSCWVFFLWFSSKWIYLHIQIWYFTMPLLFEPESWLPDVLVNRRKVHVLHRNTLCELVGILEARLFAAYQQRMIYFSVSTDQNTVTHDSRSNKGQSTVAFVFEFQANKPEVQFGKKRST